MFAEQKCLILWLLKQDRPCSLLSKSRDSSSSALDELESEQTTRILVGDPSSKWLPNPISSLYQRLCKHCTMLDTEEVGRVSRVVSPSLENEQDGSERRGQCCKGKKREASAQRRVEQRHLGEHIEEGSEGTSTAVQRWSTTWVQNEEVLSRITAALNRA